MPRRDYDDDYFDDRPRRRSRRRYEDDDDDDYDPRPGQRRPSSGSNAVPIIIAVVIGGVVLLALAGVGALLAFRAAPKPAPVAVNNPPPPVIAPPPVIGGPMQPVVPGMPVVPGAGVPAAGNEVAITNIRRGGFGAKQSLEFDYRFNRGRPFVGGVTYVAVVTEPGGQPEVVDFRGIIHEAGTMSIDSFGIGARNQFPSGTTVYVGKRQLGPRTGVPTPISNTLTLP